ncbi:MAG: hypothetical protein M3004_11935 [Bacteroidota bacterium]|nr:hypothetical protein [Bacteroidota bacterium]
MKNEVLQFYSSLRQIFTVCPYCESIIRLSDCKLYQKQKPVKDWKEKVDDEIEKLEMMEEKLLEKINAAKQSARDAGKKSANKVVRKLDTVFHPMGLNCNDCKVIFHPVDFILFKGMNNENKQDCTVKEILLLDKNNKAGQYLTIQKSIEKAVERKSYEWLTLRVDNTGKITEEE